MAIDLNDERNKRQIRKELKKYLADAQQKEAFILNGLARHFCETHDLKPEQIELVKTVHGAETRFHFKKRSGALFLPGKP